MIWFFAQIQVKMFDWFFIFSIKVGLINHELSYQAGSSQKIPDKTLKNLNYKKIFPTLKPGDCIIHHW